MLQIFSTFLSLLIVNTARIKDNSKNFYTNENFLSYILLHFGKFLSYADLSFISTKFLFLSNKIQLYFCHCNKLPQLSRWFGGVFIHFCEFKILEKIISLFIYFNFIFIAKWEKFFQALLSFFSKTKYKGRFHDVRYGSQSYTVVDISEFGYW